MKIDIERCKRAMTNIYVDGYPDSRLPQRAALIEEAIKNIQQDPLGAMREEYLGIKNYAGFGDQRCDRRYGYGPSHGCIVFRISRTSQDKSVALGNDEIYLLECVRDFGFVIVKDQDYLDGKRLNLCDVIRRGNEATKQLQEVKDWINSREYSFHIEAA